MEISLIIEKAGGASPLARELGIHRASVRGWKKVPAHHVIGVEKVTGIPRHELRADIFPADEQPRQTTPQAGATADAS